MADLLDAVSGRKEFDLVEALCLPLPADMIFTPMGVREDDYSMLRSWCGARAALGWGRPAAEEQVDIGLFLLEVGVFESAADEEHP